MSSIAVLKTIPILYNGGAYGTYLEWVLTTLVSKNNIVPPFTITGNSHRYAGTHLGQIGTDRWNQVINKKKDTQFVRVHPKASETDSLNNNLQTILNLFEKVIYIYPDHNSVLLNINNEYTKVWDNWLVQRLKDPVFADNLYSNWSISADTQPSQIPAWIVREILSYNLMPSWRSQVEWYHPDRWTHPRCFLILIKDLLYNFEATILKIQEFCNLQFQKSINELIPYHHSMLSLQKYLNQDQLCADIVNSIVNNHPINWDNQPLPLPSQSWVQWQLRNLGYEIQCHGLDTFPTNSVNLQELLYKI
jgi:hypothetical protein